MLHYVLSGLCRDNGKQNGNYYSIYDRGYIGIMEKKMETTILFKFPEEMGD